MTANDSNLYWVEYGSRDGLGNFRNDGALMAYSFADKNTKVLAAKLSGPRALGITSDHAYAQVDGAGLVGTADLLQVLRVPILGGTPAVVQDGGRVNGFVASGDTVYWNDSTKWLSATGSSAPVTFLSSGSSNGGRAADATDLYFESENGSTILRAPLAGGSAKSVVSPAYDFAIQGDALYAVEPVDQSGGVLDTVAKSGGTWQRTRGLGAGYAYRLQIVGDRYFYSALDTNDQALKKIVTGSLTSNTPPLRIAQLHVADELFTFVGTKDSVFWSDGRAIYKHDLAATP
jgi:hypothetical protein